VDDGRITIWDLGATGPRAAELSTHVTSGIQSLAFSPDSRLLAVGTADHQVLRCRLSSESCDDAPLARLASPVRAIAFSRRGSALAAGSDDGRFVIVDVLAPRNSPEPLGDGDEQISSVAFSPDDALLALGDGRGRVSLWDPARRRHLGSLLGDHDDAISALAFDANGRVLASAGDDGRVILWDVGEASWRQRACAIANRNLTREEWRESLGERPYRPQCQLPAPDPPDARLAGAPRGEQGYSELPPNDTSEKLTPQNMLLYLRRSMTSPSGRLSGTKSRPIQPERSTSRDVNW
jgi:WD40 repeat protein